MKAEQGDEIGPSKAIAFAVSLSPPFEGNKMKASRNRIIASISLLLAITSPFVGWLLYHLAYSRGVALAADDPQTLIWGDDYNFARQCMRITVFVGVMLFIFAIFAIAMLRRDQHKIHHTH